MDAITNDQRRLLALCAIRIDQESVDWSLIAREAQFQRASMPSGPIDPGEERRCRALAPVLKAGIRTPDELLAESMPRSRRPRPSGSAGHSARPEYPANLRLVPNLPPFLFVRASCAMRTSGLWPLWHPGCVRGRAAASATDVADAR